MSFLSKNLAYPFLFLPLYFVDISILRTKSLPYLFLPYLSRFWIEKLTTKATTKYNSAENDYNNKNNNSNSKLSALGINTLVTKTGDSSPWYGVFGWLDGQTWLYIRMYVFAIWYLHSHTFFTQNKNLKATEQKVGNQVNERPSGKKLSRSYSEIFFWQKSLVVIPRLYRKSIWKESLKSPSPKPENYLIQRILQHIIHARAM